MSLAGDRKFEPITRRIATRLAGVRFLGPSDKSTSRVRRASPVELSNNVHRSPSVRPSRVETNPAGLVIFQNSKRLFVRYAEENTGTAEVPSPWTMGPRNEDRREPPTVCPLRLADDCLKRSP